MHTYGYTLPSNLEKIKILRKKKPFGRQKYRFSKPLLAVLLSCYKINKNKLETFKIPLLFPSSFFPPFYLSRFLHLSRYPVKVYIFPHLRWGGKKVSKPPY